MSHYIVIRQGVYIQGIAGVFPNYDDAVQSARETADREEDRYHSIEVYPFDYNTTVLNLDEQFDSAPLFVCRHGDPRE